MGKSEARNSIPWDLIAAAGVLLVPVALALAVFPTAMVDTRELFVWGRFFPLTTLKHPPMAAWMAGLTELALPANAASAIFVGQIINAVGVVYVYATLRLLLDRESAGLFAFLFAGCVYFLLAPLSYALNSDILQMTVWLGVVYHFIRAARDNTLGQWLAMALWSAAAVLTKYSAGILFFAGAVASLAVADYRRVWINPRFYLAATVGALLLVPHFLALRADSSAIGYAANLTTSTLNLGSRLYDMGLFAGGILLFLAPGWAIVGAGFLSRSLAPAGSSGEPQLRRFLLVLALAAIGAIVALSAIFGTILNHRYSAPFIGLIVLAGAPNVAMIAPAFRRRALWAGSLFALFILAGGVFVYGVLTSHNYMQEPIDEAARIVRAGWSTEYTCGPGYIFGDRSTAHGIALAGDGHPYGVPTTDIGRPGWWDAARLRDEGAIVVYRDAISAAEIAQYLPGVAIAGEKSFTLPLLRTRAADNLTYHYFFIPPRSCAIGSPG